MERNPPRGVSQGFVLRTLVAALATGSFAGVTSSLGAQQPAGGNATTTVVAATQPAAPAPDVHRLSVRPAPATRPALQYRLLPDPTERTPGNAAPVYLMSFLQALQVPQDVRKMTDAEAARFGVPNPGHDNRLDFYLHDVPLDRLTDSEVEQFLGRFQSALSEFDVAARRDHCDWALPRREQGFGLLLPHLTSARDLANLSSLRVRMSVARRDYRSAAHGLQSQLSLARDLDDKPIMIQALVGAGIAVAALHEAETLAQQSDAPNLYWPLADLPRPFVDMGAAMRGERASTIAALLGEADLRRMKEGRFSAEDWEALTAKVTHLTDSVGARRSLESRLGPVAAAVVLYPAAKEYLVKHGVRAAEVDAMPVPGTLARYYVESFDEWWDETLKWTNLPFWEAYPGMRRTEDEFRRAEAGFASNPLLILMPSFSRAYVNGAKLDRQIAALQTVEAIRSYAATHAGRLPATLQEITDAPAPADPTTGKPFAYHVDGERAILESQSPTGLASDALRVEVTLAK